MQNVYSVCFLDVQGLSGAATYTVPAGMRAIIDTCDFYVGAQTPPGTVRMQSNATNASWFYDKAPINEDAYMSWRGRQVFDEGETFQASSATAPCDVRVSGWLLTLP